MTIANPNSGSSSQSGSATSVSVGAYQVGQSVGDLILLIVGTKPFSATIATPTGFTPCGSITNGSTVSGTDTGSMKIAAFFRIIDGTEGALPANVTISITSADSSWATYYRFTKTLASWQIMETTGTATAATSHTCTFTENPDIISGDMLVVGEAVSTDLACTHSSLAITATGATIGTVTKDSDLRVTTGNQSGGTTCHAAVTAGTASAAPHFTETLSVSTNQAAALVLVRIREINHGANVRNTFEAGLVGQNYVSGDGASTADDSATLNIVTTPASGTFQPVMDVSHPAKKGTKVLKVQTAGTAGINAATIKDQGCLNDNATEVFCRGYFWLDSLPSAGLRIFQPVSDVVGTFGQLAIPATGKLTMFDTTGGNSLGALTGVMPTAQWVRIEFRMRISPTTGQCEVRRYDNPDSATATETLISSLGNCGNGPGLVQGVRFGFAASGSSVGPLYIDEVEFSTTTWVGPAPVNFIGWGQPIAA